MSCKQPCAIGRLHARTCRLHHIGDEAAGARFRLHALKDLLRRAAPEVRLHPVLLLELLADRGHHRDLRRGIERERAFLLGARDQALRAVGPGEVSGFGGRQSLRVR